MSSAARVAASGTAVDPDDGVRLPAGEVHAWAPGTNQTLCGLALSRSRLARFPHVAFTDALPATGGRADFVVEVCPRCHAAVVPRARRTGRSWSRTDPRP